jgi:peptide subunit release factor RF-3
MEVGVHVTGGVKVTVGSTVSVGERVGFKAIAVSVPERFAALAVRAMTVGRYSGG